MATGLHQEADLLNQSLQALRRVHFLRDAQIVPRSPKKGGTQLRLKGARGAATFHVEVQPRLGEAALPALAHRRDNNPRRRILLVTSYVKPTVAEQLQKHQIEFLDAAGNAFLAGPLYVFIVGKKPVRIPIRLNRAFRPAGLRLIYVLLKNPAFLTATQRELARAAGIALGSVPVILQDLRERGYLRRMDAGRQSLADPRELLFRWEQGYSELLRPKLFIRTCRQAGASATLDELLPQLGRASTILLGGELGAAALTKHLRAETATLHIAQDEKAVMSSLRLIPDPQGNITLLRKFGTQNAADEATGLADPLLIYAELVRATGDRIQEIARMVLDQHILLRFT